MDVIVCSQCGATNPPAAPHCWRCLRLLKPPWSAAPPGQTAPALPGHGEPAPGRSLRFTFPAWVWAVAATLIAAVTAAALLQPRAQAALATPPAVGGYVRIDDPQTQPVLSSTLDAMRARGISRPIAAFYGTTASDANSSVLLLNAGRVQHQVVERRAFLTSFAPGYAAGSGASLALDGAFDRTVDSQTFTCAPRVQQGGAICVWEDPNTILLVIGFPQISVEDTVQLAVEARLAIHAGRAPDSSRGPRQRPARAS